jgi:hypothetical protein
LPRCVIFLTCSACCTMRTSLSLLGSWLLTIGGSGCWQS